MKSLVTVLLLMIPSAYVSAADTFSALTRSEEESAQLTITTENKDTTQASDYVTHAELMDFIAMQIAEPTSMIGAANKELLETECSSEDKTKCQVRVSQPTLRSSSKFEWKSANQIYVFFMGVESSENPDMLDLTRMVTVNVSVEAALVDPEAEESVYAGHLTKTYSTYEVEFDESSGDEEDESGEQFQSTTDFNQ